MPRTRRPRVPLRPHAVPFENAVLWTVACLLGTPFAESVAAQGEVLALPVSRDTWVSSFPGEEDASLGGAQRLKLKGIQELFLFDVDPSRLRGRVVHAAWLEIQSRSKDAILRATVSSLAAPWHEGLSTRYASEDGASTFRHAQHPDVPWSSDGGDLTAVIAGAGSTIWGFADASPPDAVGRQTLSVDPRVVAARAAGLSHGFVVIDDVGNEYERDGDRVTLRLFPNRYFSSREAGESSAPRLVVELGAADTMPPSRVEGLAASDRDARGEPLGPGELHVRFSTPEDRGPAGTLGFEVRVREGSSLEWEGATPVPRSQIPFAGRAGEPVAVHLRGLSLAPGARCVVLVRAIDAAGNAGEISSVRVRTSFHEVVALPEARVEPFREVAPLPRLGELEVAVLDALDKIDPRTGALLPRAEESYRRANHLFSALERRVRLAGVRNEHLAFQVEIARAEDAAHRSVDEGLAALYAPIEASLRFDAVEPSDSLAVRFFEFRCVEGESGPIADPLVPLTAPPAPIDGATRRALLVEVFASRESRAGRHEGELVLRQGASTLRLSVDLEVERFDLPDQLSFLPQMNSYGLPAPPREIEYYRLAQEHRTCLNRLAYNWRGRVGPPFAPKTERAGGKTRFDFSEFDRRFGPLLDGSAFADLPRGAIPVEAFYLPINENWPMDLEASFRGGYWIEDAFDAEYWRTYREAVRAFAEHLSERGFTRTFFELYLNNKLLHKREDWSRSSAPWVFDEPVNTQDFWALRRYGLEMHRALEGLPRAAKVLFRCDISRPQWQRDLLDGVLDVNVVGGAFHRYGEHVRERKSRHGELVYEYGSANALEEANTQPVAWSVDVWTRGGDGVLPWQTIGRESSWRRADALSLFYPGGEITQTAPVASVRLKAFRRGQQDVEYLTLLAHALGEPRWAIARAVRARLGLDRARFAQAGEDDAGRVSYANIRPIDLWSLRRAVGERLSRLRPEPGAALLDRPPPRRDPTALPPRAVLPPR